MKEPLKLDYLFYAVYDGRRFFHVSRVHLPWIRAIGRIAAWEHGFEPIAEDETVKTGKAYGPN